MPTLPEPSGGDFENIDSGTYSARCYRFIDLGSHETFFNGQSKGLTPLVLIGFELCDEKMEDGRPFVLHKRYTWSTSEKANMRKDLESWRGARFNDSDFGPGGFDVKNLLGAPAILTVIKTEKEGKEYSNIAGISKPMKGMTLPPLVNKPVMVSLIYTEFDREAFDSLSDSLKSKIAQSPQYKALMAGVSHSYAESKGSGKPVAKYDQSPLVPAGQREFAPASSYEDDEELIPF